jgi:DNA-binding response OmpR family regulator
MAKAKTFLLVEDDAYYALFVVTEFEKIRVQTDLQVVRDGVEARNYVAGLGGYANRDRYPLPDVILLDLSLPRVNGFEFLEWLRSPSAHPHRLIPVVVMSSSDSPEEVNRAYKLGANSYLIKPVNWEEFRERIKTVATYWAAHVQAPQIESP